MFVAVVAVASVVPVSLLVSMVRRVATRTVDCCLEHERQTSKFALALPASNGSTASTTTGGSRSWKSSTAAAPGWMCPNGMRRFACGSQGRVAARRWRRCAPGARPRMQCWRYGSIWSPSGYRWWWWRRPGTTGSRFTTCSRTLTLRWCWSTLDRWRTCPAARATSPTPPGWPSWARTAWSAAPSSRRLRSVSCGTWPGPARRWLENAAGRSNGWKSCSSWVGLGRGVL